MVPRPAALASPENVLEMKVLRPLPSPTESEILGMGIFLAEANY